MSIVGEVLVGVAIGAGILGIVIPVLPGSLLVWAAIGFWSWRTDSATAWVVFAAVTAVIVVVFIVKYAVPGRRMHAAGVPGRSLLIGSALGFVGFFVLPVIGLFVGFVLGVYLSELARHRASSGGEQGAERGAWESTKHAMVASGLSILIELAGALVAAWIWVAGLFLT